MKKEWGIFLGLLTIFLIAYLLNFTDPKIRAAIMEAFYMLQWYARNHTLACVVPAMFIAGAIATFFSKEAVLRHLGPKANKEEVNDWMSQTWGFSKSIIPLLFGGVFVTGFVSALIPEHLVAGWVGGNSFLANFMASLIGAMWYFATLTEIPILEALIGLGMGRGPALALLLAGPALSLPSIVVIYSVIGFKKTFVFVFLTVIMSTLAGMVFGWFFV